MQSGAEPAAEFPEGGLEALLAAALEATEEEREALFARAEPALAERVRERLGALAELGFSLHAPRAGRALPARFGRFERLERVASGGMGEVHLARDEASGELAAIKLVRPEHARLEGARRRFEREVAALARLAHPGIVRVLEVGDEDGLGWLALEWVGGASLEEALERLRGRAPESLEPTALADAVREVARRRPYAEPARGDALPGASHVEVAARLVARVADALAAAHDAGVLHRDLKPGNLLVTPAGRVLLADFGLALPRDADRMTRAGSWLGSLPYAAPEQVAGDGRALDERADVYSLGATLYELLTLRTPFLGGPEERVRRRIARGDLEPVRRLNPAVSPALARVCEAALDPDPRRRPPSARAFADDLERARSGRPVRARRPPLWVRLERRARRRPGRALAAAAAALVALSALGFGLRERALAARLARLADAELAAGLLAEARAFWPADASQLGAMTAWLARTEDVLARESAHRAERARLERRAAPWSPAERAADQAPTRERLATLAHELLGLAAFVEHGERAAPPPPTPEATRALDEETRALLAGSPEALVEALRARLEATRARMQREPLRWWPDLPQLGEFERELERARAALATRASFRFDSPLDDWRHAALGRLLERLAQLGEEAPRVRAQLERTLELDALARGDGARAWDEVRAAVRASPRYGGLELAPLFGLLPLGEDPRTGLFDFLVVESGAPPVERGRVDEETGVVLVLLPGGRGPMGLDSEEPRFATARPAHELELAPFLFARHELTVAQAERLGHPARDARRPLDGRLPVTLSWEQADALLSAHGLALPTEAQWERAARGGGLLPERLEGHANVLDRSRDEAALAAGYAPEPDAAPFADGFAALAPVGSLAPDALGLHDVFGNLAEWCRDAFVARGYATLPPRAGDGLRASVLEAPTRVLRGGSHVDPPARCHPAVRSADWPARNSHRVGVRPARPLTTS